MTARRALVLFVLAYATCASARTPLPPYDFTGHWSGTITAGVQVLTADADLAATGARTFAGTAVVNDVSCTLRGSRKRKVIVRVACADGTKARLAGILDLEHDALAGVARLRKRNRHTAATFAIARAVASAPVCGDATVETGEECDDGNTVAGDGCSPTCEREPRCGDGILDDGEECDDGNTKSDDGCSATCLLEPCQVIVPHQTAWSPAKLIATPGRFLLHARFGIAADVNDLQNLVDEGLELMIDGASGTSLMDVVVPGGTGWGISATRARYRDVTGAADGVRSIVVRARGNGIATVDLKLSSHGGPTLDGADAPPVVTVLLGDATAGEIGACGHHAYPSGSCTKRGKKLTCR